MNNRPCIFCARDAEHARRLMEAADPAEGPAIVLCVRPTCTDPAENARFAEEIYRTARAHQAEMALLFSDYPAMAAAQFIRRRGAGQVVLGMPQGSGEEFITAVRRQLPRVKTTVQGADETVYCFCPPGIVAAGAAGC